MVENKVMVRKRFIISGIVMVLLSYLYVNYNNVFAEDIDKNIIPQITYKYTPKIVENKNCENLFGFGYIFDRGFIITFWWNYYQTKVFVTNIAQNSPAQKAGLKVSDEILKINGIRIAKFKDSNAFDEFLSSLTSVDLEIKTNLGNKKNIHMNREIVCSVSTSDFLLDSYWGRISDVDLIYHENYINGIRKVSHQLSPQARNEFNEYCNKIYKLRNQKDRFVKGYQLCGINAKSEQDLHKCLDNLVNSERQQIAIEEEKELREQALRQQQQAYYDQQRLQQQQINAMNNYANALRNQNVNVNTNVNHSGTVNVNGNFNHTINRGYGYYYGW